MTVRQMTNEKMEDIIERATKMAVDAHWGQKRKGDDVPYILHPVMVAVRLVKGNFPKEVIAAGMAHDVLDVANLSEAQLRDELGDDVADVIKAVSSDKSLPWMEQKKKYLESVREGSEAVKAVAVADRIDELIWLLIAYEEQGPAAWQRYEHGPDAQIWLEKEVLKILRETWRHSLIDQYEKLIQAEEKLK